MNTRMIAANTATTIRLAPTRSRHVDHTSAPKSQRLLQLGHLWRHRVCASLVGILALASGTLSAATTLQSTELSPGLYMISGNGGNVAFYANGTQSLLIDAQFAATAPQLQTELNRLANDHKIGTLVNTHFHKDHVDGNAIMGQGATIIAHPNTSKRLRADDKFNRAGLPTKTVASRETLTFGQLAVELQAMPASHTDTDVVVRFNQVNVVHMGDLFFADRFPFIDLNSGGSVAGYIANVKQVLASIDEKTKIIPGHGPLMDKAGLTRFLQMLEHTRAEVQQMQAQGMNVDAAVAKGLSSQWQSWSWNFINEERWIRTLYGQNAK